MSIGEIAIILYVAAILNVVVWAAVLGPWFERNLPFMVTAWNTIRDTIKNIGTRVARRARKVRH